jgi:hypothetical protein
VFDAEYAGQKLDAVGTTAVDGLLVEGLTEGAVVDGLRVEGLTVGAVVDGLRVEGLTVGAVAEE